MYSARFHSELRANTDVIFADPGRAEIDTVQVRLVTAIRVRRIPALQRYNGSCLQSMALVSFSDYPVVRSREKYALPCRVLYCTWDGYREDLVVGGKNKDPSCSCNDWH